MGHNVSDDRTTHFSQGILAYPDSSEVDYSTVLQQPEEMPFSDLTDGTSTSIPSVSSLDHASLPSSNKQSNSASDRSIAPRQLTLKQTLKWRDHAEHSCYRCKTKRLKCDGDRPDCGRCSKHGLTCEYRSMPRTTCQPQNQVSLSLPGLVTYQGGCTGQMKAQISGNDGPPYAYSAKSLAKLFSEEVNTSDNVMSKESLVAGIPSSVLLIADGTPSPASELEVGYSNIQGKSESDEDTIETDSESLPWSEYYEHSPEWDPDGSILSALKQEYIEKLITSFNPVWQHQPALGLPVETDIPSGSSGSSRGKHRTDVSSSGNESEEPPTKRHRQYAPNDNGGNGNGGDDGKQSQNTPPNAFADDAKGPCQLFACPFVKRYGATRYVKCCGRELRDVSRVKYHLFRDKIHRIPIYCPRCSKTFQEETLRDNHILEGTCTKQPPVKWEGITARQRERLSGRSLSNSAVENWNAVYKILFPGEPLPSSPYIELPHSAELLAFREHVLSKGPTIGNNIIRDRLTETLRPHEDEVRDFFNLSFPDAFAQLFEGWSSRSFMTSRSIHPQQTSRSPPARQAPRRRTSAADTPTHTTANSPSRSDSALGNSVGDGNQTKTLAASARRERSVMVHAAPDQLQQDQSQELQLQEHQSQKQQQLQTNLVLSALLTPRVSQGQEELITTHDMYVPITRQDHSGDFIGWQAQNSNHAFVHDMEQLHYELPFSSNSDFEFYSPAPRLRAPNFDFNGFFPPGGNSGTGAI